MIFGFGHFKKNKRIIKNTNISKQVKACSFTEDLLPGWNIKSSLACINLHQHMSDLYAKTASCQTFQVTASKGFPDGQMAMLGLVGTPRLTLKVVVVSFKL